MNDKSRRYFVCPLLPKNCVCQLNGSIAANNFCYNLISSNIFTDILPYLPVGDIDKSRLQYPEKEVTVFCNVRWRSNPIFCKFAFISENISMFHNIKKGSYVWFYNLPYTIILLFILLRLFKPSVKCNLIMLDYTPGRKGLRSCLNAIEIKCINKMHGIIKLSDSALFTVKNSCCLPGVVPADSMSYPEVNTIKKTFLISGALGDNIAMLPMLLSAFAEMPDMTLHITGKAPDMQLVESYTSRYKNIIYHGMVEYDEYLHILHETPFLLSTRNPSFSENRCNFPSKIIEALLHNRIVISTLHYKQLDGVKYFKVASDSEIFINNLREIVSLPHSELLSYANQGGFVRQQFSCNVWKDCMIKIENNCKKSVMQ